MTHSIVLLIVRHSDTDTRRPADSNRKFSFLEKDMLAL